jgi:LuxR family transcriptional regulator, quorum-sensing system regulator BjaR1
MAFDLMEFIQASNGVSDQRSLVKLFIKYISQFGYHQFTLAMLSKEDPVEKVNNFGLMVNYPDYWLQRYKELGYIEHDPVYANGLIPGNLFRWRDLSRKAMNSKAKLIMDEAAEFGLCNGIGLSFLQPGARVAGFGISSQEESPQDDPTTLSALKLASFQCFEVYSSLHPEVVERVSSITLSPREREVLLWASLGKTKPEIADQLTISVSSVKRYCESIFAKLGVNNLAFALARAIRLGLIHP